MGGGQAGVHAELFHCGHVRFSNFGDADLIAELGERWVVSCCLLHDGVLRCQCQIGRAHEGVGSRRVNLNIVLRKREPHRGAFRSADPVALHGPHLFRPRVEGVEVIEQFLRVIRDFDEPLINRLALNGVVTAPAFAVDNLFVGEDRLIVLTPVHIGFFFVSQSTLHQPCKEPLFPAVILGRAGCQLPIPVVSKTKALQLGAHIGNILLRPLGGRHVVLNSGIFGG